MAVPITPQSRVPWLRGELIPVHPMDQYPLYRAGRVECEEQLCQPARSSAGG